MAKIRKFPPGKAIGADDLQIWARQRNGDLSGVHEHSKQEKLDLLLSLVAAGRKVTLFEKERFEHHKVCGEFVSSESVDLLANLLNTTNTSPAMIQKAIRIGHARLFSDDRILHANIVPPAASIARIELDSALWDSAERNGVEARQGFTVQNVRGGGPFQVDTADQKFEGRLVINASGRWSTLNSKTRSPHGMRWLGVKAHFCEPPASDSVDLYFFEGGYCGVQPVGLDRSTCVQWCAPISPARFPKFSACMLHSMNEAANGSGSAIL